MNIINVVPQNQTSQPARPPTYLEKAQTIIDADLNKMAQPVELLARVLQLSDRLTALEGRLAPVAEQQQQQQQAPASPS